MKKSIVSIPLQIAVIVAIYMYVIGENTKIFELPKTAINSLFFFSRISDIPFLFFFSALFIYFEQQKNDWFLSLPKNERKRPWDNYIILTGIFLLGLANLFSLSNAICIAIMIIILYFYLNLEAIEKRIFYTIEFSFTLSIGVSIKNGFLIGCSVVLAIIIFIIINAVVLELINLLSSKKIKKQS